MSNTCGDGADGSETGTGAHMGIIAGATAMAAAVATGPWAVALAFTSGAATFYQNVLPEEPDDYRSFGAVNWKELIRKIADAGNDMDKSLDETYGYISDVAHDRMGKINFDREKFFIIKLG